MAILKKRDVRRSVHQQGLIALDGGFARRICVVTNISQSGARLTLDDGAALEKRFKLSLNGDVRNGHACEVMWQRGKSAGVRFIR